MKYKAFTEEELVDLNARLAGHEAVMAWLLAEVASKSDGVDAAFSKFDSGMKSIRRGLPFEVAYHAEQAAFRVKNAVVKLHESQP